MDITGSKRSWERILLRTKVLRNESSWAILLWEEKVPGSELARILLANSLLGGNWPGNEKARNHITTVILVCQCRVCSIALLTLTVLFCDDSIKILYRDGSNVYNNLRKLAKLRTFEGSNLRCITSI